MVPRDGVGGYFDSRINGMFGIGKKKKPTAGLSKSWQASIDDHVIALAWSPDGSQLAAAAVSGPIVLFDAAKGQIRHTLSGHGFGTTDLSWHPKGAWLCSSGQDGKVRFWSPTSGQPEKECAGGAAWVEHIAWSPDGTLLATAAGKKVRLWNQDGQMLREWANHASTVADIQWRPRSLELASVAYGQLSVWKPSQDAPLQTFEWKGSMLVLSWSPDGKYIATGDQDNTVHFWIMKSGEDLMMSGYPSKVRELSWDATGRYLATGGSPTICVWDTSGKGPADTKPIQLEAHAELLKALAYQRFGPLLASACGEGLVALWRPGQSEQPLTKLGCPAAVSQLNWSPDDRQLAVGCEDGDIVMCAVSS